MITTAIGAFLGALLSILASVYIEYQRKPKLRFEIEEPPADATYLSAPAKEARFVRVLLCNDAMPGLLRWLGRDAAMQCYGHIQFYHFEDGALIFAKPMPIRWAGSDEPVTIQALADGRFAQLFDPTKYNAAFRRNCFASTKEAIDVAARFDSEDDCYGWPNETYLNDKGWRNPDWKLPKGRYLVKVTVLSSGEPVSGVFQLENSVARLHFRLSDASREDAQKLK